MFTKILIANRDDKRSLRRSHMAWHAQRAQAVEPREN
jgi:hypothetical protein